MMQKPKVKLKASLEPVENTEPWAGSPTNLYLIETILQHRTLWKTNAIVKKRILTFYKPQEEINQVY